MGRLQRSVYWKTSLIFFLTAFMFFVDVFIVNRTSCVEPHGRENLSITQSPGESIFSHQLPRRNDSFRNDDNGGSSVCLEMEVFSYGQTMYMTGLLIGSLFGGTLSDRYGKRLVLVVSTAVQAVTALSSAFLPYAVFHLAARCIAGITCCCINISCFSLGVEWTLPQHRMWPPALLSFSFSLGMMGLAPLAYLTSGWMQFHLAMAVPQLLCLPLYLSIPESPRWLLLKAQQDTLEEYQSRSQEDREFLDQLLHTVENEVPKSCEKKINSGRCYDFVHFKSPTIMLRLCIMSYIGYISVFISLTGLASALTYYGICFNMGNFGVNIYLAQFFSGLSETPTLLVPLVLGRCGRRPLSMGSLLLSGSACLLSLFISKFCDVPMVVMALALMGKLCVHTMVIVSLLYGIELFPTIIRQKCMGLVNLWYRVGCIVNAVVAPRGRIPLVAMLLYGGGPILGVGLCLLLPETSGVPLPDTVLDCETQHGLQLQSLCCCTRQSPDTAQDKEIPFLKGMSEQSADPRELSTLSETELP